MLVFLTSISMFTSQASVIKFELESSSLNRCYSLDLLQEKDCQHLMFDNSEVFSVQIEIDDELGPSRLYEDTTYPEGTLPITEFGNLVKSFHVVLGKDELKWSSGLTGGVSFYNCVNLSECSSDRISLNSSIPEQDGYSYISLNIVDLDGEAIVGNWLNSFSSEGWDFGSFGFGLRDFNSDLLVDYTGTVTSIEVVSVSEPSTLFSFLMGLVLFVGWYPKHLQRSQRAWNCSCTKLSSNL